MKAEYFNVVASVRDDIGTAEAAIAKIIADLRETIGMEVTGVEYRTEYVDYLDGKRISRRVVDIQVDAKKIPR